MLPLKTNLFPHTNKMTHSRRHCRALQQVTKMMDSGLKMMNFVLNNDGFCIKIHYSAAAADEDCR